MGPIGGGFGLASASAGGVAVAGAAAAGSSEALTTSLEALFFVLNMTTLEFVVAAATLSDNTNPDAADAMMISPLTLCVCVVLCVLGSLLGDLKRGKRTKAAQALRGFE